MNNIERTMAILNYEKADRLPAVHFGCLPAARERWYKEGKITLDEFLGWRDGDCEADTSVCKKLGADFNWYNCLHNQHFLNPLFEEKLISQDDEGHQYILNHVGVVEIRKEGLHSIPAEIDYTLKDRESWQEHYLPRLQFSQDRINISAIEEMKLRDNTRTNPRGLHCGSLFGEIRNILGVPNSAYLLVDDPELFDEIVDTVGNLTYQCAKAVLETGISFEFGHFWEDICYKNGSLINPRVFAEKVGPHYKRITNLLKSYGINLTSVDCDGKIDDLVPVWLDNGVNIMFPIEYGTWEGDISPWREKYGKELRGVGGMNKNLFSEDYAAIDKEIERLKPLVALGGYIPCIDHRINGLAKWENVQYYFEKVKKIEL